MRSAERLLYEFAPHLHINLILNPGLFARLHTQQRRWRAADVESTTRRSHTQTQPSPQPLLCTYEIIIFIENATEFWNRMFHSMWWLNENEVDAIAAGWENVHDIEATEKSCRTEIMGHIKRWFYLHFPEILAITT